MSENEQSRSHGDEFVAQAADVLEEKEQDDVLGKASTHPPATKKVYTISRLVEKLLRQVNRVIVPLVIFSTSGVVCVKIESTKIRLEKATTALGETYDEAQKEVLKSSDPVAKRVEKALCDAKNTSCDKNISTALGPKVENTVGKLVDSCNLLSDTPKDICVEVVERILIGGLLPLTTDYAKCKEEAAECYSKIKKN